MQKKCRKCKDTLDVIEFPRMNLGKYGVWSTCVKCICENHGNYTIKRTPLKRSEKPVKSVSVKRKNRLDSWGREDLLFDKVRQYKKHCYVCWILITWDETFTFPHILAKWMYKSLRLFPQNIARACSVKHHDILDTLIAYNNKNWIQAKRDIEKLILSWKEVVIDKTNLKKFI